MVGLSGSSAGSVLHHSFRSCHPEVIVDCSMVIVPRAAVLLLVDVSVAQLRAFVVSEERHEYPFVLDVGVEVVGSTKTVAEDLFMEVYRASLVRVSCFFGDPHCADVQRGAKVFLPRRLPRCSHIVVFRCLQCPVRSGMPPLAPKVTRLVSRSRSHPCPDWIIERTQPAVSVEVNAEAFAEAKDVSMYTRAE